MSREAKFARWAADSALRRPSTKPDDDPFGSLEPVIRRIERFSHPDNLLKSGMAVWEVVINQWLFKVGKGVAQAHIDEQ
jgi:hypothetical protein